MRITTTMTMTARAALPAPPDPVAYHDPHHPTYGFHTTEWHETSRFLSELASISVEERYRREANAHAYRQHGTPQNWLRYLILGYFVYDDCSKFDALWMKYSSDPIICHRMVWYNFLYHVDRNYAISEKLTAWATDVSQPYLQRHAPQFLAINTMESKWNDLIRGDHDVMDIEVNQWTQVGAKKKGSRSKSPPISTPTPSNNDRSRNTGQMPTMKPTMVFDLDPHIANTGEDGVSTEDYITAPDMNSQSGKHQQTDTECRQKQTSSNDTMISETSSIGKQSALQKYLTVPTNDGTYRLTFRWTPRGAFANYNDNSTKWLTEVHSIMTELFSDSDGSFFRWESTDLTASNVMSELSPGELREFLSPNITFLPTTSQVIFGARVCFASKFPGQWKNKERTKQVLKDNQLSLNISNSTTKSGRIVTAGYILFKAARTTHRTRFLQSLRMKLPPETPFFDILQFHKTPMEQKINHLVVQCGENHVSPLSKALSELLTGHNSSLYLPRLALAKLTADQISSYFEMQDTYSKSLKSLSLSPMLTNLDKPRKEHFADGTVVERSTREWAADIFSACSDISARCEVVNGGYDQKAYLLVPEKHFSTVNEHLRQYKLRINPIERREARFRDSLPGLPSVIHIDTSTQQNLDFLAQLSSADVWKRAPPSVRGVNNDHVKEDSASHDPTLSTHDQSKDGTKRQRSRSRLYSLGEEKEKQDSSPLGGGQGHDDQTTSTKSATQSLNTPSLLSNTTTRRLNELEALFRGQQHTITETSLLGKQMDASLQQTITTLQENSDKLIMTMERQHDTHVQLVELSTRVSRLTEIIDRMASQMDTLTTITIRNQNQTETRQLDTAEGTARRRTIDEVSSTMEQTTGVVLEETTDASMSIHKADKPSSKADMQHSDHISSPNKKKSRQQKQPDKDNCTLHVDLEDMSLGSDTALHSDNPSRLETNRYLFNQGDPIQIGGSLLDDSSDEFSTHTEVMPDLDTQYKSLSDPEGGDTT